MKQQLQSYQICWIFLVHNDIKTPFKFELKVVCDDVFIIESSLWLCFYNIGDLNHFTTGMIFGYDKRHDDRVKLRRTDFFKFSGFPRAHFQNVYCLWWTPFWVKLTILIYVTTCTSFIRIVRLRILHNIN